MRNKLNELLSHYKAQYEKALIEKGRIEDFEPFRNDERVQLVSREILELSNAMELKVADFN